jgi:hypothetical protein
MMQSGLIPQVPSTKISTRQANYKLVSTASLDTYPTINKSTGKEQIVLTFFFCHPKLEEVEIKEVIFCEPLLNDWNNQAKSVIQQQIDTLMRYDTCRPF